MDIDISKEIDNDTALLSEIFRRHSIKGITIVPKYVDDYRQTIKALTEEYVLDDLPSDWAKEQALEAAGDPDSYPRIILTTSRELTPAEFTHVTREIEMLHSAAEGHHNDKLSGLCIELPSEDEIKQFTGAVGYLHPDLETSP